MWFAMFLRLFPIVVMSAFASSACAQLQSETFVDWRVDCAVPQGDKTRTCQMFQTSAVLGETSDVFLITISSDADSRDFGVMTVPAGVYLAPGIEIHVDNRRPFKVLYKGF